MTFNLKTTHRRFPESRAHELVVAPDKIFAKLSWTSASTPQISGNADVINVRPPEVTPAKLILVAQLTAQDSQFGLVAISVQTQIPDNTFPAGRYSLVLNYSDSATHDLGSGTSDTEFLVQVVLQLEGIPFPWPLGFGAVLDKGKENNGGIDDFGLSLHATFNAPLPFTIRSSMLLLNSRLVGGGQTSWGTTMDCPLLTSALD